MENTTLIQLKNKDNTVLFYPERGGIITSLLLQGKELLYQDMLEETLFHPKKNVRGGIPFLFPQAGALSEEEQKELGYHSPQHGVIRNKSFSCTLLSENKAQLTYTHTHLEEIPYEFSLQLFYTLGKTGLKIEYIVKNNDTKDFCISPGFHPYFAVVNKDGVSWEPELQRDIIQEKENWKNDGTFRGVAPKNYFSFQVSDIGNITLFYDEYMKNFWIWSLPQKDFICVEPVCGNEGNIVKNPIVLHPGASHTGFLEITLG